MIALWGLVVFMTGFVTVGLFFAGVGVVHLWRVLLHPGRQRRRLTTALADAHSHRDRDDLWAVDWQDYRFLLLDEICHRVADQGWQLADQAIYRDRWELRFRHVGGVGAVGSRSPASIHDHVRADPCDCRDTDFRFAWDDPDDPLDRHKTLWGD